MLCGTQDWMIDFGSIIFVLDQKFGRLAHFQNLNYSTGGQIISVQYFVIKILKCSIVLSFPLLILLIWIGNSVSFTAIYYYVTSLRKLAKCQRRWTKVKSDEMLRVSGEVSTRSSERAMAAAKHCRLVSSSFFVSFCLSIHPDSNHPLLAPSSFVQDSHQPHQIESNHTLLSTQKPISLEREACACLWKIGFEHIFFLCKNFVNICKL